jgi:hypothetical protein
MKLNSRPGSELGSDDDLFRVYNPHSTINAGIGQLNSFQWISVLTTCCSKVWDQRRKMVYFV